MENGKDNGHLERVYALERQQKIKEELLAALDVTSDAAGSATPEQEEEFSITDYSFLLESGEETGAASKRPSYLIDKTKVAEINGNPELPAEIFEQTIKEAIIFHLNKGNISKVSQIIEFFPAAEVFFDSGEIHSKLLSTLSSAKDSFCPRDVLYLLDKVFKNKNNELYTATVKAAVETYIKLGDFKEALNFFKTKKTSPDAWYSEFDEESRIFQSVIHDPEFENIINQGLQKVIQEWHLSRDKSATQEFISKFGIKEDTLYKAASKYIQAGGINLEVEWQSNQFFDFLNEAGITTEHIQKIYTGYLISSLASIDSEDINKLRGRKNYKSKEYLSFERGEIFLLPQTEDRIFDFAPKFIKELKELADLNTLEDLKKFAEKNPDFYSYISKSGGGVSLEKTDLQGIEQLNISLKEAEIIKRQGVDIGELASQKDFKKLYELLKNNLEEWQDEENINAPFEKASAIFGYDKMFKYIDRPNLSRHDGLHAFTFIIRLYQTSGLGADAFFGNILQQVQADDGQYEEGTAHHKLNSLAQSVNLNFEDVLLKAKRFPEVKQLQELTAQFQTFGLIFASWKNFKRYAELASLVERTEILRDLQKLKEQGKNELYAYVETLAFHPNSNVDMQAVVKFWRDPDGFLELSDEHTPEAVHNRKKPSNYTEIPNLDLTAEQLRDALVEKDIDTLQVFKPLEIEYNFRPKISTDDLRLLVKEALGSRKEKVQGKAKNTGKLFTELKRILQAEGMSVEQFLGGEAMQIPERFFQDISAALFNPEFGIKAKSEPVKIFAKINLKSDPDGVLAGNDTACCMPFGSGKNNVYTFNPDTSLFTLQIIKQDGTKRTIAQSVLTKDKNIGKNVQNVISYLNQSGGHINEAVPEDILSQAQFTLACDNIEVAPNFKTQEYKNLIAAVYKDFFREYLTRFGVEQNFDVNHVVIGKGYTDALTELPEVENTYAPAAPVGYSDKTSEKVYNLDLKPKETDLTPSSKKISTAQTPEKHLEITNLPTGVSSLTFEDTLPVAYIEGKAYADNQSLMEYMHRIENTLIAKDINNAQKERVNLSLKFVDQTGKTKGYMVAYEGKMSDEQLQEEMNGKSVIYVGDLAVVNKGTFSGSKAATGLINGFVSLYKEEYLDKGNFLPIFAYAREQTSYKLIQRQLETLAQGLNMTFRTQEFPTYTQGGEEMHPILIEPVLAS